MTSINKVVILGLYLLMLNGLAEAQVQMQPQVFSSQTEFQGIPATTGKEFSAGSAECRQEADGSNVCIYRQDAQFIDKDAKSNLRGPTIAVYRDKNNQIVKIQAIATADKSNKRASYQGVADLKANNKQKQDLTQNNQNATMVNAEANIITIYPPKSLMTFEGQAKIVRKYDTITGSYLEYDTVKQTILAKPKGRELTTIVLQPRFGEKK